MSSLPICVMPGEPDPRETLKRFPCEICGRIGEEEYPDASSYRDASEDRAQRNLPYAGPTPNDLWVCSQPCRSQLMFQTASPAQRELLKRYEIALSELIELEDSGLHTMLAEWECDSPHDDGPSLKALKAIGRHIASWSAGRELPPWIEANMPPAEKLQAEVRESVRKIEWDIVNRLRTAVGFSLSMSDSVPDISHRSTSPLMNRFIATVLGSSASVIASLKSALSGEASE